MNLDRRLHELPSTVPTPARDTRVRARCRRVMAARAGAVARGRRRRDAWTRRLAPVLVAGFGVVYLALILLQSTAH
jgi:hypothetical protein